MRRARLVPPVAALLLLSACGGSTEDAAVSAGTSAQASATPSTSTAGAAPALPVTVASEDGEQVTIDSIERIIPLDGDVAEIVFALGLGDNVVATDLSATYPQEADDKPEIGYQRSLAAEPIAAFDPTVLLATDNAGPPEVLDQLRDLGYPLVLVPDQATPQGPATKIRSVAAALGVPVRGEQLAAQVQTSIDEATEAGTQAAAAGKPRVVALYLRGTQVQTVLGAGSTVDWLIDAAGGTDVAEELTIRGAAPIEPETMVKAAPDVLLVPEAGLASVGGIDGLLEVAGVAGTPAGKNRRVLSFDDQLLLGGGPRTGQLLQKLVEGLHGAAPQSSPSAG